MFCIKNNQLFLILLFCFSSMQGKFKINNIAIDTITEAGDWIIYNGFSSPAVTLRLENNDNLEIDGVTLNNPEKINQCYSNLINEKGKSKQKSSAKIFRMKSGEKILQNSSLMETPGIFYQANVIEIEDSLFKANSVSFMGRNINLYQCFMDVFTLEIECNDPASKIQVIRFIFDANSKMPHLIEGEVDFNNNSISNFLVVGVKKIEILFRPHAFR